MLLAILGGVIVFGYGTMGVCLYDFGLHVKSASTTPSANVRGKAYYYAEQAHEVAANPKAEFRVGDDKETHFDGKSLRVVGIYSCKTCCLDLIKTGSPPPHVVLLVDYADGKRENKLIEIPPGPATQRLLVEVP